MTASRILQGTDGGDKLYTVRPRTSRSVTNKRGTPSSIRFNIPEDFQNDTSVYYKDIADSGVVSAFKEAIDSEGLGFINFIALSVSYSIQERSQIMHTFGGEEAIYFYGRAPVIVQLTGLIVDDLDNDQFAKFMGLYQNFLRGSKASSEYCYVTLSLNNAVFEGAFTSITLQQSSDRDTDISFSAQFIAKSFTLASADKVFADSEGKFYDTIAVRDPDPTITRESIAAIVAANERAASLEAETDDENDSNNSFTPNSTFLDIPKSFGKLPTLEGLLGFSAADITKFFGSITSAVSDITAPFTDIISQVDDFARSAMSMVDSIESGLDSVIHQIDSVTKQVYGTVEDLEDTYTKICNFPESISNKLGAIGNPGGTELDVSGSDSVSSSTASTLLAASSNTGASRGTPEGTAATLSVSSSSDQTTSLSVSSSSSSDSSTTSSLSTSSSTDSSANLTTESDDDSSASIAAVIRVGG